MSGCPFNPTPEQRDWVEAMIGYGVSEAEICTRIKNPATGRPISLKMLHEHFPAEIAAGAVKVAALVNNWIVKAILGRGDVKDERLRVQLAISYAKYRIGPKETVMNGCKLVDPRDVAKARRRNLEMVNEVARRLQAKETGEPSEG